MPPVNRCALECPGITAERVLYRHDQLRSSDTLRLRAIARLGIMGTAFAAHATYTCPQRQRIEDWQPSTFCMNRAAAIMSSRDFNHQKLTDHEHKVLGPYLHQ